MIEFVQQGTVCHLKGRITQADVITLWPQRQQLLNESTQILSLSGLEYSDSAGMAFLLALVREHRSQLVLSSASPQLKKLIDLYDLDAFFTEEAH
ncbi:STAS domain-containing protein [Shewanella sp. NKUCC05_KAH]|uniref:STAS domain-containing protein n=1 Tax=Shewanella oncorhynchi TaxID=2726434 RepID=A0AA50KEQ1_9GAMM|nr:MULTISPECIES: STAS domain-containing protein [Shewanella]MBI1676535.1 STAS domain-containing protein [Shewanella sp. DW31]MBW3516808.1 STAS domain-containing protein [Shewanella sp. NKUCC01_JLK]MBW3529005.1 STAS domain-containing protein [Shewanella sp. NKUCC05_KAH]MBW3530414.1 STAS domain-containing protein [Shewanella sp. NKUCC06_TVS]RBP79718.1 phospholipid transport system transporter-binding protein [Shewanella putrefaciens]